MGDNGWLAHCFEPSPSTLTAGRQSTSVGERRRSSGRSAASVAGRARHRRASSAPASSCGRRRRSPSARGRRSRSRSSSPAFGCAFAGLCYAEFASMIPIAGSAYTYSYATMGEFVAWIIGWDLVLEYAVGAATVAIAWSEYLNRVLELRRPARSRTNGAIRRSSPCGRRRCPRHHEHPGGRHPAAAVTLLLIRGTQESALVNNLIVITKVSIVLMVIVVGWGFINPANHTPFIPAATTYIDAAGRDARLRRHPGHPRRRRRRLLRLHRVRRGVDGGAGGEEPEARHADRHSRLARRLHGALRAVRLRAERRGDRRGLPHGGREASVAFAISEVHDRLRVAGEARDRRHPGRASRR